MAILMSDALRNARLQATETHLGLSGVVLNIYSGTVPTFITDAAGTILVSIALPDSGSGWLGTPSGGAAGKATDEWSAAASGSGVATYFRMLKAGTTVEIQGTVSATGGGGNLTLDNVNIVASQVVTVDSGQFTEGNKGTA